MKCCPYCGSIEYMYQLRCSGVVYERHTFDGSETDNGDMFMGLTMKAKKTVLCGDCERPIGLHDDRGNIAPFKKTKLDVE